MYDALTVAKYIIDKCFREGAPVTNLRLQKLLYFVQLESYKKNNKPLFEDDMYAWQFGPVVLEVYYEYNVYAGTPILLKYNRLNIDFNAENLIASVLKKFKSTPIWKLVEETHKPNGPWDITVNTYGLKSVIKNSLIAEEAKNI